MTSEQLKDFTHRTPFIPFDVHMADGVTYTVDDRDFFAVSRRGDGIAFSTPDDRLVFIDCAQIVSIKTSSHE
jgi:hypothetical protein